MGNTNITLPDGIRSATTDQVDRVIAAREAGLPPPTVVDVPHAYQDGGVIVCTMGNWSDPAPDTYHYQWHRDGADAGVDTNQWVVTPDDVGKTFACTVTASNPLGEGVITSNDVVAV